MKKLWKFVRHYRQFSFALIATLAAFGLQLAGYEALPSWILCLSTGILLLPLLWSMIQDLREGTYGVDILAATAIIVAIIMQEYWAAMVIVLMLTSGESLEDFAEHRASRELDALLTRAPQKARLLRGKQEIEVKASEVREGDMITIRPGEVVPVDAVVTDGTSSFDESSLTGESLPEVKHPGQMTISGSINIEGVITAKALHSAADSQYEQIIKLVKAANSSKAPFVRMADRYAIPFTVVSFGIAAIAWILSGDSLRFLQVLVVATPCPLILAAPIAIISGMSRAAKQGIIIKNGSALERLAMAQTFGFDKTGTITAGTPQVDTIRTYNGHTKADVLTYAAGLEQHSNHVLAAAVKGAAQAASIKVPKVKNVREIAGHGLTARIGGKVVLVGRLDLLKKYDIQLPGSLKPADVQETAAYVAAGDQLAGIITFKDEIRPEAKQTLARLRSMGVSDILMVTGDNKTTAKAVAKKVGIQDFVAEALPGDKIRAIEKAAAQPVAFVGDGVNDAPVLTASDVGIALGAKGSTAASESADIVVMLDNLEHVADGRAIARRTFFIAKQSIFVGIGLSVALMLIFATGKFKPIYGAAIQEVVDIIVIFNALRAHGRGNSE